MVCYRADDVVITELPKRRCDCGAECTQCSSCAVAEWNAAHPDCEDCCPLRGSAVAPPAQERLRNIIDASKNLLDALDTYDTVTGAGGDAVWRAKTTLRTLIPK